MPRSGNRQICLDQARPLVHDLDRGQDRKGLAIVSKDDVPDPLWDLEFFHINELAAYMRHLTALARKK
jgi:hypothetical protein